MRTVPRTVFLASCVFFLACSSGSGTSGSGGAGTGAGTGGFVGSGGASASGGNGAGGQSTGGSGPGTGGSSTGGASSGGRAGTGGATNGSGGTAGTGGLSGTGGNAGGGGTRATGGASGAIGSTGGAGTGGSGAGGANIKLGTGGPFSFPQGKKSGMCTLPTAATASAAVQSAYDKWKTAFVSASGSGATGNLRVVRTSDNNDTVSEGIGYGMLAAVYMADRTTFDGLWNYAKAHLDAKGLMNWQISSSGTTIGQGSATDADEDIAWALLMASDQWSSATYLSDAKDQINAMLLNEVAADGMLKPGDGWGPTTVTFPDYFSPAYFRVFAAATGNSRWTGDILNRNYEILDKVSGTNGLVPDRTNSTYQAMGNYSYDACRTPWRIGMDYCFNGEARAKAYLTKIGTFFDGIGAANIGDGYSTSGGMLSSNKNMAFIGPAGVAGMAGYPQLLDDAFSFGAQNLGDDKYYPQSLKIITMLMMSGNFLDYSRL